MGSETGNVEFNSRNRGFGIPKSPSLLAPRRRHHAHAAEVSAAKDLEKEKEELRRKKTREDRLKAMKTGRLLKTIALMPSI